MAYTYLTDKKPPKFSYTVNVKPKPPADDATVHVLSGDTELFSDELQKDGKGDYELDLSKLKVENSPVTVKFVFTKDGDPKSPHETVKTVTLAEPAPKAIKAPKSAVLGQEIELKVTKWVALVHEGDGDPKEVTENDGKRIQDAKDQVKWQVDGADIDGTGESVKLTIADQHLGKAIKVEAYLGTPTGRATADINVYKLESIDPDDSATDVTKVYVNLDADETQSQGRTITLKATVVPAAAGVPVYFKIDESKVPDNRLDTANLKLPAANMASVPASAKTDKDGFATVKFKLSSYGGDQFRVSACLNKDTDVGGDGTKLTRWWQVWRALDFEVSVMERPDGGIKTVADDVVPKLVDRYSQQFIELRKQDGPSIPFQRAVSSDAAGKLAKQYRNGTAGPRYFHLLFVNAVVWEPKPVTQELSWYPNDKNKPDFGKVTLDVPNYYLDDTSKKTAISGATWKMDKGGSGTFSLDDDDSKLTLSYDDSSETWTVTLDVADKLKDDDANKYNAVTVKLKLKNWIEGAGYSTDGRETLVGVHFLESAKVNATAPLSADDVKIGSLMTAMHEPAHKMGMAAGNFPEAPPKKNDTTKFDPNKGWHCYNNKPDCVMYEDNNQTAGRAERKFCDRCQDALRARNLAKIGYSGGTPF